MTLRDELEHAQVRRAEALARFTGLVDLGDFARDAAANVKALEAEAARLSDASRAIQAALEAEHERASALSDGLDVRPGLPLALPLALFTSPVMLYAVDPLLKVAHAHWAVGWAMVGLAAAEAFTWAARRYPRSARQGGSKQS